MNLAVNRSNNHIIDDKINSPTIVIPEGNKQRNLPFNRIWPYDSSISILFPLIS